MLDNMSPRTYDTVHVFYVKSGQTAAHEIIGNITEDYINSQFTEFIHTLGWPVLISKHPGNITLTWYDQQRLELILLFS